MSFLDLVRKRQSVRKFSNRPVSRDIIERCLEAARLAPSACNSQPWSFVVVDDAPTRQQLAAKALSGLYSMNIFAAEAPVLIAVVTGRSKFIARMGAQLRSIEYRLIDIGVTCEHLVLQAAEEGVGTCWLGWFNERAVRKTLGLPRTSRVDILIAMGYPEADPCRDKKRKTIDEIRRYVAPGPRP